MAVEVTPLGVKCNIQCQYCYQNPIRDAGNIARTYDLARIKDAIKKQGRAFSLFGGEPLLMPKPDLEELWSFGYAEFQTNAIQTNGTLIDDDHIRMFKQYQVHVGVSLDGPGELNDARWAGSLSATRHSTAKAQRAVERLCREKIHPSIIITLSRANAATDRLPALYEWIRELDHIGVRRARLHVLESENDVIRTRYGLSVAENTAALLGLSALERELTTLRFDMFTDMRNLLRGDDEHSTCIWTACDPYTTRAVSGIGSKGQRTNCGRTNKDGIDHIKSETPGFERYIALYFTPQEAGGCKGCRFFLMCKGQCPGTAVHGDWRNRSEHCATWKALYRQFEQDLLDENEIPVSRSGSRREIEAALIEQWAAGTNGSMAALLSGTY